MANDVRKTPIPETTRLRDAARERFAQDLPRLLHEHLGCWVAYHGDRQVAIARHTAELYDACRRQHLPMEEVALFEIASPDQEIPLGPMAFV
jgi:hypothetical protein